MQRANGRKGGRTQMKGENKLYGWGLLLTVFGGAGLAEISTSEHGNFIFCAAIFALGFAMCLYSYKR